MRTALPLVVLACLAAGCSRPVSTPSAPVKGAAPYAKTSPPAQPGERDRPGPIFPSASKSDDPCPGGVCHVPPPAEK